MRSRSWVARSIATPVSWMRAGSGPTRVAWARNTRPIRPSRISSESLPTAGLKRSTWPTISFRPATRAAAAIRSPSSSAVAIGFSTNTCLPASSASSAMRACCSEGVQMQTASRSARSNSQR